MSKKEQNNTSTDYQYKALFDNSTIGLYRTTPDGKIILANHAMVKMLGYNSFYELAQRDLEKNGFEPSYPREHFKKTISEYGEVKGLESAWKRKDGSVLFVRESAKSVKNKQDEILYYEGSVEDITDKKIIENQIQESEEKYHQLYSSMNQGLALHEIIFDNDGKPVDYVFLDINDSFTELTGLSREMVIGKTVKEVIPEIEEFWIQRYADVVLTGNPTQFEDFSKPLDRHFYVSAYRTKPKQFAVLIENITERKKTEIYIKNLNRVLMAIRSINQLIVKETEKRLLIKKACEMLVQSGGYRYAFIILVDSSKQLELFAECNLDSQFAQLIAEIKSGKFPNCYVELWNSSDKISVYNPKTHCNDCAIAGFPNEDIVKFLVGKLENDDKIYGFINLAVKPDFIEPEENYKVFEEVVGDISFALHAIELRQKRDKAERDLIEAKEKAEEMNKLKSNFLANMSHELRTPMGGIIGFTRIIKDNYKDDDLQELAALILQSGSRLMETLNLILDISRIEAGKLYEEYSEFDIINTTKDVIERYREEANEKNLFINTKFKTGSIRFVNDERLLYQSVNNLISNAIKFTNTGGITIEIFEEKEQDKEFAIIKVNDTGIGIPESKLNLIWEEFRQASEGLNRSYEGTGLGLTVTKMFVEKMSGEITVESIVDKGSTFTIKIPIQEQTAIIQKQIPEAEQIAKPYILSVEDDFGSRNLVKRILRDIFNVDLATNGPDALDLITQKHYDAILMDINLGRGMSGLDVAQEIKKLPEYNKTPIIALTAYAMAGDKERFLANGCTHYISKPFKTEELVVLLRSMVDGNK
ncbi:MAG: PAS domain-containing sensor histidine kinase [Bacteroidetes bacterium]|nr:MAG: PAS domain-containing sensor histidine kinase [Bacteroidota bacterium]